MVRKHVGCRSQVSSLPPVSSTRSIPSADFISYTETLKIFKAREAKEAENLEHEMPLQWKLSE